MSYELKISGLDRWVLKMTINPPVQSSRFASSRHRLNGLAFSLWRHLRAVAALSHALVELLPSLYREALFDETLRGGIVGSYLNGNAIETHVRRQCEALNVPLGSPWHVDVLERARKIVSGLEMKEEV
jgi:hypothetical protein